MSLLVILNKNLYKGYWKYMLTVDEDEEFFKFQKKKIKTLNKIAQLSQLTVSERFIYNFSML